jgi:ApbE superfamily uncharacterized protein (UPF0280 family)
MMSMVAQRFYRDWVGTDNLVSFTVTESETDLLILADRMLQKEAREAAVKYRKEIEAYIHKRPEFERTLTPIAADTTAPAIVQDMLAAASKAGVGPMAGVAGAIAAYVGGDLLAFSKEVIVENGGDIFLKATTERVLGIYASASAFTKRIGIAIAPQQTPLGICTSSGTVGHSLSFGRTDAALIVAKDTILADCVATKVGNVVTGGGDIEKGIAVAQSVDGISGVVIIIGDKLGSWGDIELVSL